MIPLPSLELVKILVISAVMFALMVLGWTVRGWKEDAARLKEKNAVIAVVDAFHAHEGRVAATLEEKLAQLRANQTIVEKHYAQIVDRPVYRNVCLDDDGLRLIEAARRGEAPASQPAATVPAP